MCECKCNTTPSLKVGDIIYGYCHGTFGNNWNDKRVEHIGRDWVVLRATYLPDELHFYTGDPDQLVQFTTPEPEDD